MAKKTRTNAFLVVTLPEENKITTVRFNREQIARSQRSGRGITYNRDGALEEARAQLEGWRRTPNFRDRRLGIVEVEL